MEELPGGPGCLTRARPQGRTALEQLLALGSVNEFLCDGEPPPDVAIDAWLATADESRPELGLWMLWDNGVIVGCGRLSEIEAEPGSVELAYLLHPEVWGRGLATRMSVSLINHAFSFKHIDSVMAGTDGPNIRSIAVMQRLGMQYARSVDYALGPGVEYRLSRDQWMRAR